MHSSKNARNHDGDRAACNEKLNPYLLNSFHSSLLTANDFIVILQINIFALNAPSCHFFALSITQPLTTTLLSTSPSFWPYIELQPFCFIISFLPLSFIAVKTVCFFLSFSFAIFSLMSFSFKQRHWIHLFVYTYLFSFHSIYIFFLIHLFSYSFIQFSFSSAIYFFVFYFTFRFFLHRYSSLFIDRRLSIH